jgi:hypothetical protein
VNPASRLHRTWGTSEPPDSPGRFRLTAPLSAAMIRYRY